MDTNQKVFENFEVPDPIRINKAIGFIRKAFSEIEGLNVLECGMAKGGVADRLRKEGANCYGVDINPRQMEGVRVLQTDLNEGFPKFDIKFDVVFAGEVIEHLLDDVKFIRNCKEVLKPGGILILTTPNLVFGVNRFRMLFGKMPLFSFAPYHYRIYNAEVLKNSLKEAGMKTVRLTSSHVLFSTRKNKMGKIFEVLGDLFPKLGAHLIICAKKD